MVRATGIGSLPGQDLAEATKVALGATEDLPFLPELPGRGVPAGMIGRSLALITDLGADLQPDGWRIGVGEGIDQRRARSLLAQDLDVAEEMAHDLAGPLKIQVAGPLTLAASVERPKGDKMLADHGARRELSQAFVAGLENHVADVRRRFAAADLVVQVDEPAIRAVMDGSVPTASGYATHRRVDAPEIDALLRPVVETIVAGGAVPVLHSCAAGVPVGLLRGAGFAAVSFDLVVTRPDDAWAEAFDAGTDLWVGVTTERSAERTVDRVVGFFSALGFEVDSFADRLVVTPPCGLAGSTEQRARETLSATVELGRRLDDRRRS